MSRIAIGSAIGIVPVCVGAAAVRSHGGRWAGNIPDTHKMGRIAWHYGPCDYTTTSRARATVGTRPGRAIFRDTRAVN